MMIMITMIMITMIMITDDHDNYDDHDYYNDHDYYDDHIYYDDGDYYGDDDGIDNGKLPLVMLILMMAMYFQASESLKTIFWCYK